MPVSPRRHRPRVARLAQVFLGLAIGVLFVALSPGRALAQDNDGLEVSSSTQYVPDPALEQIAVTATYTLTNLQPDEVVGDGVRSFFYTKWVIAMPATTTNFRATREGQPLIATIERDPDTDDVVFGSITLPFNLNYQQTVQLDVTYTIPGGEPRTGGTVARVNDSFLSFSVWAAGDPGRTDVRIVIPAGFAVDLQGDLDELRESITGEATVLEAIGIQQPQDFFGQVYGRNDSGLLTETAALPDATATIRAWPDDPEWAEFVANAIEEDVPVIQDLTGLAWPAGDIEVIETVTPYLFGYGGWFNASSGLIEIGDSLERDLILHELSHGWFNDQLIDGRWITEGLAEEFASRAIEATGGERLDPTEPDLDDPLRVPLAAWASPWTLDEEVAFDYEQFHYNASWWVIRQITNDIGLDAFSDVLIALRDDVLPYQGEGPGEETTQPTRWTHMFDLLEDQGATNLDELFTTHVLTPTDHPRLELRRVTRDDYDRLAAAGQGWSPPLVLRQAMSQWQFDDARFMIERSENILALRDQADALAGELDVTITHPAEAAYEIALSQEDLLLAEKTEMALVDDLTDLRQDRTELREQAAALDSTVAFAPMSYDNAVLDVDELRTAIAGVDDLRSQVDEAANALGLAAPGWPASSGPTDFAAAAGLAEARLATLSSIARATDVVDAPRGLRQRIGLLRSDPDALLDQARSAFEADELDEALSATSMAETMIENAASTGESRLLWGGVIVVLVIAAMLTIAWRQRRQLRSRAIIDVRNDTSASNATASSTLNR